MHKYAYGGLNFIGTYATDRARRNRSHRVNMVCEVSADTLLYETRNFPLTAYATIAIVPALYSVNEPYERRPGNSIQRELENRPCRCLKERDG